MRVKRNTKKIIRRKGSKKNLKKYVGGGPMFENGKLTKEGREKIEFMLVLALATGSIATFTTAITILYPGTSKILVTIIYYFAKLIPVGVKETASNVGDLASFATSNIAYIMKGLLSLLWSCKIFIAGIIAPTVFDRTKDLIESVTKQSNGLDAIQQLESNIKDIKDNTTYPNAFKQFTDILCWAIEKSNGVIVDNTKTIEHLGTYIKNKEEIVAEIHNIESSLLQNSECEIGGKVQNDEDVDTEDATAEIKTAIDAVIADDTDEVAKNTIDNNFAKAMQEWNEKLKDPRTVKRKYDDLATEAAASVFTRKAQGDREGMEQAQKVLKELLEKRRRIDTVNTVYKFGIDNETNGGKKNTQKRRSKVSRKHRK
jgi:hypothetical protein